jgi:two-component system osmolarity sensor histidine kinase EnvZ
VTRLLRSLFARNIALLVALVALSQVCSLTVLMHYVQTPRIERAAATFANYIDTLGGIVAAAPPDARAAFVERLHARRELPAEAALEPPRSLTTLYRSYQRSTFLAMLRRHLPADVPVRWQIADDRSGGEERLWLRVRVGGEPYWIALAIPEAAHGEGFVSTILLSLALAALATLTAYVIQRHLNRPLDDLARAARHLSAGGQPEPLPVDGPTEIAQVSRAFNQMSDIRTPLTKLRLAMAMAIPAGGDQAFVASSENYLDQIDGILQQFMDYAGSGAKEVPVDGDLNTLVASLAGDFAGLGHEFELTLGDLPSFPFRPVSTMRLVMNLMQNAVLYGVTGLSVRTWLDADARLACIAIGDRGKGIAADEMEKLKEPFRRGRGGAGHPSGTGLGLAIVERIAKLHGGTLVLRPREGGGTEAVVTMRLG